MANVVIMPKQGQSVESCIVTEFKKKEGDKVAVGDILFSYETDKASFDEESQFEGTVLACFFADNDEIPVLTNVMVIGNEGEDFAQFAPEGASEAPAAETPADPAAETPADPGAEEPATGTVGCMKAGICSEGPAAMASECTAEEGEELLDACPAGGEACDIGEEGITMYFYADAPMSCADYKAMIAAFSNMGQ